MLKTKIVTIKITKKSQLNYYREKGYIISGINIKIDIKISDLSKNSIALVDCICDNCKSENRIQYYTYLSLLTNDLFSCIQCQTICENKEKKIENNTTYIPSIVNQIEKQTKKYVIYKAELNNKIYIGQTINFEERKKNHKYKQKWKCKTKFQRAMKKYGFENIKWSIIFENDDKNIINKTEIYLINYLDSIKNGYNTSTGGDGGDTISNNPNRIDIIKKNLKSHGYNPDDYIEIDEKLENKILQDYENGGTIKGIARTYKLEEKRVDRLLKKKGVKTEKRISHAFIPDNEFINIVINNFTNGKNIKEISKITKTSIMLISRILHDSGVRISKRFKNGKRYNGQRFRKTKFNVIYTNYYKK